MNKLRKNTRESALFFLNRTLEMNPKKNIGPLYTPGNGRPMLDWTDIKYDKIRTKWEVVETPMKLNDQTLYDKWI